MWCILVDTQYVYGPFPSKDMANEWADRKLPGREDRCVQITQFIDAWNDDPSMTDGECPICGEHW